MANQTNFRIEIPNNEEVWVFADSEQVDQITEFLLSQHQEAIRQTDFVAVSGNWRNVLPVLAQYPGDPVK